MYPNSITNVPYPPSGGVAPLSPPVGKGGDKDDDVTCVRVGGGMEGGFVLSGVFMTSL